MEEARGILTCVDVLVHMPIARWEKQNKTGRFNLHRFYSDVLSTLFPSGCFPFLSPPRLSFAGSEVSVEIREVRQDLSDYTPQ